MDPDLVAALTGAIAPYDKQAFAAAIGALQLVPANMERAIRLHALAHACAAAPAGSGLPRATVNRIRTIAMLPALSKALAAFEDPFENTFTETFVVGDERFTVVNGPAEGFPYVLHHLLVALQALPIALPMLADDLRLRVMSILRLVDAVLRRIGIPADIEGVHHAGPIALPDAASFNALRDAVVVAKADLPAMGVALSTLADFTTTPGTVPLHACELTCAFTTPLLDCGDDLVLLMPAATVEAVIQMLITRAIAAGAGTLLARAFHDAITRDVRRSFERMGITVTALGTPDLIDGAIRAAGSVRFDGKDASLVITTDSTDTYARGVDWEAPETSFAGGAITFALYQSFARPATLLSDYHDDRLTYAIQACDLATLAVLEESDPLALWKYVCSTSRFWDTTMIYAPTTLAAYYVYWSAAHSYYVSDDDVPSLINADASGAAELRAIARSIQREGRRATYADLAVRDQPTLYNSKYLPIDLRPVQTPHVLPQFRRVMDADQEIVMDELARDLRAQHHLQPVPIPAAERVRVLNAAVAALYAHLQREVATLASANLLEDLLVRNEAVIRETIVHRALLPERREAYPSDAAHFEVARSEIQVRLNTTGALRFLIEYVVAQPPTGTHPLTIERLDRLQALTAQIIAIASLSDLLQFGVADFELRVLGTGRVNFNSAQLAAIGSGYSDTFATTEIARVARAVRVRRGDERLDDAFLTAALTDAVAAEFGVALTTLRRFFAALVDIATMSNDAWFVVTTRAEFLVTLLGHGIAVADAERLLDRFSLAARKDYLHAPGVEPFEIYPWRVERKLSHRRRPLVLLPTEGASPAVLFAGRHVLATWRDLIDQLVVGTFPAQSTALRTAQGTITEAKGRVFNATVAAVVRDLPGGVVRENVTKVKTANGTLHVPGDFDVLVAIPARRRLLAIECKDIAPARDVQAQSSELKALIVGDPTKPKGKSFVQKQQERVAWLEQHVPDVLAYLRLPLSGRWSVEGAIVTSQVVPTPFMRRATLPIVSLEELRRLVTDLGAGITFRRRSARSPHLV